MKTEIETALSEIQKIAVSAHAGQIRDGGQDYYRGHIEPVVEILEGSMSSVGDIDDESLLLYLGTAYLHDVLEDCDDWNEANDLQKLLTDTLKDIEYGNIFADLIFDSVVKLSTSGPHMPEMYQNLSKTERLVHQLSKSPSVVITVKLADRYQNLLSMEGCWSTKRQRSYVEQTKKMLQAVMRNHPSMNYKVCLLIAKTQMLIVNIEKGMEINEHEK